MARLLPRPRRRRNAAHDQPLCERVDLERRDPRRRGDRRRRRRGHRLRQGVDRLRRHTDLGVLRPLLPRLHALRRRGHAPGAHVGRWRADLVARRRRRRTTGGRSLPGDRPVRQARPRLPVGDERLARDRRVALDRRRRLVGGRPFASQTSTALCRVRGFRAFRCPRRTSTPPGASGRRGTTAPPRAYDERRVRRLVGRRRRMELAVRGHPRAQCAPPRDRHRPRHRPHRPGLHARDGGRNRHGARRVERGARLGNAATASPRDDAVHVDAPDDLGPHARRLRLGALAGGRPLVVWVLASPPWARGSGRPSTRRADSDSAPSGADRVPDGLQLEEALRSPTGSAGRPTSGRPA